MRVHRLGVFLSIKGHEKISWQPHQIYILPHMYHNLLKTHVKTAKKLV